MKSVDGASVSGERRGDAVAEVEHGLACLDRIETLDQCRLGVVHGQGIDILELVGLNHLI